jgi:flagellar assembly factor FliW
MKVIPETPAFTGDDPLANAFTLPAGLIGFRDYTRAELLALPDHQPFLWMKLHSPTDTVHFVVLEPGGLIGGYEPELFDDDAAGLGLSDAADALVLNVVTLEQQRPLEAKVNLLGPIVVNRRTRVGRQLVIANYSLYSAHHPLVEAATPAVATA